MKSSSGNSQRKYDVFVSFRGKDTRRGLVSHLEKALNEKKIEVFIDDKLKKGKEISPTLISAIEESDISLIVFSKCYADSVWCLRELEKIVDCKEKNDYTIVPIFYDVNPSTVRHQIGSYGEAFAKLEMSSRHDLFKLESWKIALKKAANLSGLVSSDFKNDAELVEKIVIQVLLRLKEIKAPYGLTGLIGIQEQIEQLESLLSNRKSNVHIIGIWGMGGIGKTTMAGIIFGKVYHEYEGCHFVENVREEWSKCGKSRLKNKLISELLGKEDLGTIIPVGLPDHVVRRLRHKKVLVVLDDVDDSDQLEDLTGGYDWFGPGSTIIMTSRDKSVFSKYCSDQMYEVKRLNPEHSFQLFSLHAFKEGCLKMEGSDDLSKKFINYANGNPLALKVLGKAICGKSEVYWRSQLAKLESMPFPEIQDVLKISYDALDQTEKDIFLYIACFFKGSNNEEVVISLLDNHLYPEVGLATLEDKALIIKSRFGDIHMHDLIQEMGRQIVREESPKSLGKRRHLWDRDDIYEVLKKNLGTELIESINLQCEKVDEIHIDVNAFKRMINLKFLKFECEYGLSISGKTLDLTPVGLRYFNWNWYPLEFPPKLCLQNLVEFYMSKSKLENLWDGIQDFGNLKVFNLSGSRHLKELPDMSKASKLQSVDLSFCCGLHHVHPSILSSRSLERLYLEGCSNLKKFSMSTSLEQLKRLDLGKTYIEEFCLPITHGLSYSMTFLNLCETNVESLPESIKQLSNLQELHLFSCSRLQSIPELPPSIAHVCAYGCKSLEVFTPKFSTSSALQQHLSPQYPLDVDLRNCEKLGEDTVRAIAKNFVYFVTMVAVYQLPVPIRPPPFQVTARLPGIKIPEVFGFLKIPETIQGRSNTDLMAFIFCFDLGKQSTSPTLHCSCDLQASNGESILCREVFVISRSDGDLVTLIYDDDFNREIINGIKESRGSCSATDDKYTKVSFSFSFDWQGNDDLVYIKEFNEMYPTSNHKKNKYDIKRIGVYRICASDLHYIFDANTKSSQDIGHPQLRMKNKRKILVDRESAVSLKLSKQLLPHSRKWKKKSKKLKAIHLPIASDDNIGST